MFCPKCGTQINDGVKFCPKCGAENFAASPLPTSSPVRDLPTRIAPAKDIAVAVATAVLALLSFMPLFSLRVTFIGGSYSMLDLISLNDQIGSLIGSLIEYAVFSGFSAQEINTFLAVAKAWYAILLVVWVCSVVYALVGIVNVFRGKHARGLGFILFGMFGVLCIGTMFALKAIMTSSSELAASTISATPWLWVLAIASIVAFVAMRVQKPKK